MLHHATLWIAAGLALLVAQGAGDPSLDGFYLGTLTRGDRTLDVAVTLATDRNAVTGTYYYFGPSDGGEIALGGTRAAGRTIRLQETTAEGDVTGRWEGKLVGSTLEGLWTNAKNGQQWSFRLGRAEQAAQFEGSVSTRETGSGPIAFRTARVPNSDHRVPLITDFRDARVVSDINSTLMAAANGARCDPDVPDDHTFEAEVTFAGSDVLSVRIIESWFCQAAYPNSADRSLVFDLRTGDIVHLQDLFRKDVPPERLYALLFPYELSRARPGAAPVASGDDDRECHEFWSLDEFADQGLNPGFHLTAEGIVVTPDFPHVFAACANAVTVPYSALGPIVVPDSPLARLGVTHTGKPMRYRIQRPAYPPEKDIFFTPPLE